MPGPRPAVANRETTGIVWPAVIRFCGSDELSRVPNQETWKSDLDLHPGRYQPDDVLIDARGDQYALSTKVEGAILPEPTGETCTLAEIIELVRKHVAQTGACCVSKLYAASIPEAFALLSATEAAARSDTPTRSLVHRSRPKPVIPG